MYLSKQQPLEPGPKVIQKIDFTATLDQAESAAMFSIIKEPKETILDFSEGTKKVFWNYSTILLAI